jgi:hypothetical protein
VPGAGALHHAVLHADRVQHLRELAGGSPVRPVPRAVAAYDRARVGDEIGVGAFFGAPSP